MTQRAEAVIIGGGCMGASTAYHLARRGITNVILVERAPMLGMESTGRNAGGVRHQFSLEANVRLSIESIRALERFEEDVGTPIDFHQDGYLFLLSSADSVAAFAEQGRMQRRLGVDVIQLEPEDVARLAPGVALDGVLRASYCARDGIADPNGVTQGFARFAQARGVTIQHNTEVLAIDVRAGSVRGVQTSAGRIATPVVINAGGAWAGQIGRLAGLEIPITPLRRHIFIAEPPGGAAAAVRAGQLPNNRIMIIDFETTFYFHREGNGILFGMGERGGEPDFDTTVQWDLLDRVVPVAVGRLPVLGEAAVTHAWAGLYEMTPDAMPVIGPSPGVDGFFVIAGFSGHGFQHAPAAGRLIADAVIGDADADELRPFALARFAEGRSSVEANVV